MDRRNFVKSGVVLAGSAVLPSCKSNEKQKLKLGFDNFSIRAMEWKAPKLLEYAAEQKVDTILFSDLRVYDNHEESYLKEIKAQADQLGIEIQAGTEGICPTSASFKKTYGTAEEHLALAIRVAKTLGSSVVRCYQGSARDRKSLGGLKPHMAATIATCKKVKSLALESGVKIAIENHAGDMAAYQLRELIEKAGPDYVGATIDSGNATWTVDTPMRNLEILAPYVVCSGIRDTMMWDDGNGIKAHWTAMGDGVVNWREYFTKWDKLCPNAPVQLEIISPYGKFFPHKDEKFWKDYKDIRKSDYDAYKALAAKGHAVGIPQVKGKEANQKYQISELERSIKFCRNVIGLGRKV
ncbi:MAG: sugar phosphate isomerase/epimerase [Lentisphaeraceae bacterium]|nr:sugar phosphate isomerase/epimerase [Lentisphaeraceae bacterium]